MGIPLLFVTHGWEEGTHSPNHKGVYAVLPPLRIGKGRQSGHSRHHKCMMNEEEYDDDVTLTSQHSTMWSWIFSRIISWRFFWSFLSWGAHHIWVQDSGSSSANKPPAIIHFTLLLHSTITSTSQSNTLTVNIDYNKQKQQEHLIKPLAQHS